MPTKPNNFVINVADLKHVLKQIKIAEATSLGYTSDVAPVSILQAIMDAYGVTAVNAAQMPAGLRTVDGTFNNLLIAPTGTPGTPGYDPGTSEYGAADTLFPRLTDPLFNNDGDGDQMYLGPGAPVITNTDYGLAGRSVADADPRIISNLIVDMSINNPAAIEVALARVGITGSAAIEARNIIIAARNAAPAATAAAAAAQVAETAALATVASEIGQQAAAAAVAATTASALVAANAAVAQDVIDHAAASAASQSADQAVATAQAADAAAQAAVLVAQSAYAAALAAAGSNDTALAGATSDLAAATAARDAAASSLAAALATAATLQASEVAAAAALATAQIAQAAAQADADAAEAALASANDGLITAQGALATATTNRDAAEAALAVAQDNEAAAQADLDAAHVAHAEALDANQTTAAALADATSDLAAATSAHEGAVAATGPATANAAAMQAIEDTAASNLAAAQDSLTAAQTAYDAALDANGPTAAALANANAALTAAATAHAASIAAVTDAVATAHDTQALEDSAAADLLTALEDQAAALVAYDAAVVANQAAETALADANGDLAAATTAHDSAVAAVTEALAIAADFQAIEDTAAGNLATAQGELAVAQLSYEAAELANAPTAATLAAASTDLDAAITAHETAATAVTEANANSAAMQALEDSASADLALAQADQITAQVAFDAASATLTAYDNALSEEVDTSAGAASAATTALAATLGTAERVLDAADHVAVTDALVAATAASSAATGAHSALQVAGVSPEDLDAAAATAQSAQQLVDALTALETALADDSLDALDLVLVDAASGAAVAFAGLADVSTTAMVDIGRPGAQENVDDAQANLDEADLAYAATEAVLATATANRIAADDALALAEGNVLTAQAALDEAQAAFDAATLANLPTATALATAAADLAGATSAVTAAEAALADAVADSAAADVAVALAQQNEAAAQLIVDAAQDAVDGATLAVAQTETSLAGADQDLAAADASLTAAEGAFASAAANNDAAEAALALAQENEVVAGAAHDEALAAVEAAVLANQPSAAALAAATSALADAGNAVTAAQSALAEATGDSDDADAALALAQGNVAAALTALDAAQTARDAAATANQSTADALALATSDLASATLASDTAIAALATAAAAAIATQALVDAAADDVAAAQAVRSEAQAAFDAAQSDLDNANDDVAIAQATLTAASAASAGADAALLLAEEADAAAQSTLDGAQAHYDAVVAASGPAAAAVTAATTALANANAAQDATEAALATASAEAAAVQALEDAAAADLATTQAAQAVAQGNDAAATTALNTANAELAAAQTAATAATAASDAADLATGALDQALAAFGLDTDPSGSLLIRAESPDVGLSPSFNSWMTYFGQFFDHGLDLVTKGGSGTVYIPLQADDPLVAGADGIFGNGDDLPAHLRFMALTRATQTLDANGIPQHENTTTSFVDQNQTYTSHSSHQVFLREYEKDEDGHAVSTGKLLDGTAATGSVAGSVANWADVKAQALTMLGIRLSDFDVHNVPLLVTDQYGKFIPGANGFAQLVMAAKNPDGSHVVIEGTAQGISTVGALGTGHAFLNDIAHHAAPAIIDHDRNPGTPTVAQTADVDIDRNGDGIIDLAERIVDDGNALTYDDELLNSHFITGDGRGNENIALTAVHSIFHTEHNRTVEANKATILEAAAAGDLDFLNEWLLVDVTGIPADLSSLEWDGERLFQAARFSTEMQYQHMVFEEFARRIQPMVDPFVFNNSPEIDASIVAEFAHTVYRFGHSMLTGTVDRLTNDLATVDGTDQATLLAVFLNPQAYVASGATLEEINANLVRGLSRDVGSHIDEFIVDDVRSNLVGLPLDLGALNIARGRDTGVPSLNETRRQLYEDSGLADLKPYESWADFAGHIKNVASLVNFIAAFGTHASITSATTLAGKRAAAELIVFGGEGAPADRLDFLHATGTYTGGTLGGLNLVDLWIGGLAEANPEFGGMLGTTFNYVFEAQMEDLQNGDRMYYLTRTQGMNMLNQLEANTFADMVMRTTALGDDHATHLSGHLFITPDYILELDRGIAQQDYNGAAAGLDPTFADGEPHLPFDQKVTRTFPGGTVDGHDVGGTLRFKGGEHVVLGGTEGNDKLYSDIGDDTLWGDGGNDYLNAGTGADNVFGGEGDDIIEDPFGDDMLRGQAGNDVITSARGFDLMFGNEGQDVILVGQDAGEAFGGQDDDFILGGAGQDFLLGNEGDDWMEGGNGFDTLAGDNSELFFNSEIQGHDVLFGQGDETDYDAESGDDIMGAGASVYRYEGMFGFDWGIGKGQNSGVSHDLNVKIFVTDADEVLRDRFDHVEALSGHRFNDVLDGDDRGHVVPGDEAGVTQDDLFLNDILTQEGIDRIAGFNDWFDGARETLFGGATPLVGGTEVATSFRDGNILIGGDGNDVLRGRGGFDLIDGDAYLNVRIGINVNGTYYSAESLSTDTANGPYAGRVYAMVGNDPAGAVNFAAGPAFGGRSLNSLLLDGTINPGAMSIVREIKYDDTNVSGSAMNIDAAVFHGTLAEYDIEGRTVDADGNQLTRARDVNGDGFIAVRDRDDGVTGAIVNGVELDSRRLLVDDTDLVKNIEELRFADQTLVIAGPNMTSAPVVDLHAYDMVTTMTANYADNFNVASFSNSSGTTAWTAPWVETGDNNAVTTGQIQLNGGGTEALRFVNGDGASITRALALDPTQPTVLSYTYSYSGLDTGDNLRVEFAADGVNFVTVQTIAGTVATNANLGPTTASIAVTGSATSAIRFTVSTLTDIEGVRIEDLSIVSGVTTQVAANDGIDFSTTYIEDNPAIAIALNPTIVDVDSPLLVSAQIRLTNAQPADLLSIAGTLPAGITAVFAPSPPGVITLNLSGSASPAAYMAALQAVRFSNTSLNPGSTARTIEVTVSDADGPSTAAVTTVEVVAINDAPVAIADAIVTNITSGNIVIPEWVLLANDSDPEGAVLDITAVSAAAGVTGLSLTANPGSVTFGEDGSAGGTFTYTVNDGAALDNTANGTVTMTNTGFTTLADNFNGANNATPSAANNSTGTTSWAGSSWVEADDNANIRTGQVAIDGGAAPGSNVLRFGNGDGASITRGVNLAGVTNAALSLTFDKTGIDVGESVLVQFAADGINFTTLSTITNAAGSGANANGTLTNLVLPGTLGANSAIRFVSSAINDAAESILIDNVTISYGAANSDVVAGAGNQILVGNDAASSFTGGNGNDTVLAGGGNDIINWSVGNGRDFVDGGANGAAGDRFIVNGNGTVETFVVYARAEAIAAGVVVTNAATEIVITRNGIANVVAELDNIEEITINTGAGADTVTGVGNFGPTSLFFNTITVNPEGGRDTIDASQLTSAHRLVLNSEAAEDVAQQAVVSDYDGYGRGALRLMARMEKLDFGGIDFGAMAIGNHSVFASNSNGYRTPTYERQVAVDVVDTDFVQLPQYEHRAGHFDAVDYLII